MTILMKKRNNWMENVDKIPKILIKYFFAIQVCFELDYGFVSIFKRKYRCLLKNILRIKSIAVVIGVSHTLWNFTAAKIYYIFYFVQYALYVIILSFSTDNLYSFLLDIVDTLVWEDLKKLNRLGFVVIVYTFVIICLKVIVDIIYCTFVLKSFAVFLNLDGLVHLPLTALEVLPVIQVFTLLCVYLNLNSMKEMLLLDEMNFVHIHSMYVSTAVCWNKIESIYSKLVLVAALFDTPKLMILLWRMLYSFKNKAAWVVPGVQFIMLTFISIHIFVPVFFVEMVNTKCKEIRLSLNNILIKEAISDETKLEVLNQLEYMEERRIVDRAWNVMPLDLQLSRNVIHTCVTYLIVIIQFTHLYG